jgi:hypothetical protein
MCVTHVLFPSLALILVVTSHFIFHLKILFECLSKQVYVDKYSKYAMEKLDMLDSNDSMDY